MSRPPSPVWQMLVGSAPLEWSAEQREESFAHRWLLPPVNCWLTWLVCLESSCLQGDQNWAEQKTGTRTFKASASVQLQAPFLGATFTLLGMRGRRLSLCSSSCSLPPSSGETRVSQFSVKLFKWSTFCNQGFLTHFKVPIRDLIRAYVCGKCHFMSY